jgi:hypothetical protein
MNTVMPSGIHTKLSHMLQDPIVRDEDDGALHLAAERSTYLDYACAKLYRILSLVADKTLLHSIYRNAIIVLKKMPVAGIPLDGYDVITMRTAKGEEIVKMDVTKREIYTELFATNLWWYASGNTIILSPKVADEVSIVVLDKRKLIPSVEYEDVVLLLAAERAYETVGNERKSQQYAQQFASEMQLIGTKLREELKSK